VEKQFSIQTDSYFPSYILQLPGTFQELETTPNVLSTIWLTTSSYSLFFPIFHTPFFRWGYSQLFLGFHDHNGFQFILLVFNSIYEFHSHHYQIPRLYGDHGKLWTLITSWNQNNGISTFLPYTLIHTSFCKINGIYPHNVHEFRTTLHKLILLDAI
jgi:hypothetical protein